MFWKGMLLIMASLAGMPWVVNGQSRSEPPYKTTNTHENPTPKASSGENGKDRNLVFIIKKDTKKFLAGNDCFENVTEKMGFKYIAVPKGQPYYASEFERLIHNFGAKMVILFKNGPFWKLRINKTYKKCKYEYGDFIG